jgi:hypothetical protein
LNDNRITTVGTGLAGVLAMMTLVQVFILPEYLRRPFTTSTRSFSFPLAATANTVCRWAVAAPQPVEGLRGAFASASSRRAVCADATNSSIPPRHNSIELYSARSGNA